jgi:hypothetical protein
VVPITPSRPASIHARRHASQPQSPRKLRGIRACKCKVRRHTCQCEGDA